MKISLNYDVENTFLEDLSKKKKSFLNKVLKEASSNVEDLPNIS